MNGLPLADAAMVRRWLVRIARANRRTFTGMLALYVFAAVLGLAGPQLLGVVVDAVATGRDGVVVDAVATGRDAPVVDALATGRDAPVDALAAGFVAVLLAQALTRRRGHIRAAALGERLLATAREEFVEHVLRMPIGTVEAAGTGDLLSRATTDVDRIEYAARYAAPQILTSAITLVITAGAMLATSPLLAAGALVSVPLIVLSTRWYRPRATPVLERMLWAWGDVQASTTESVTGARTVEALGLHRRRLAHNERALSAALDAEYAHRALLLRWLPCLELSYVLPIAAILAAGCTAPASSGSARSPPSCCTRRRCPRR